MLATEEVSKIPALLVCLEELASGKQPDWADIDEFLNSHHAKLLANQLYWASQREPEGLGATGSRQWQEAVKAARDMNARKQSGFYVTLEHGTATSPMDAIDRANALFALKLARISFNMFELVSRAFTVRHVDPKARVEIKWKYSLFDEPVVG